MDQVYDSLEACLLYTSSLRMRKAILNHELRMKALKGKK